MSYQGIFAECETCHAKPGTPLLCFGCRMNRETIANLNGALQKALDERDGDSRLRAVLAATFAAALITNPHRKPNGNYSDRQHMLDGLKVADELLKLIETPK